LELPAGFFGYIVNNTANQTIDVVILNTPPANQVWRGSPGTLWNTADTNWAGDGIFANGDTARFDDTAVNPSVTLGETVYVGGFGVLVTNDALPYTISGGASDFIGGTAPMNKWGTNSLAINARSQLPLTVHEGSVLGSLGTAEIGSTLVTSNGTLDFAGKIARLVSSGNTTLSSGAEVVAGVDVNDGILSNSGVIKGGFNVDGGEVSVSSSGRIVRSTGGTDTIDPDASVLLNGVWENGATTADATYRIDVFGTLTGTGQFLNAKPDVIQASGGAPAYWSRLVIGAGGTLSPGGGPGSRVIMTNYCQLDFAPSSTIVIDVDPGASHPLAGLGGPTLPFAVNSDTLLSARWSTRTGTLRINNVGATPFADGMVINALAPLGSLFGIYTNRVFDGTLNQVPVMDPPSPGLGLQWDLSDFAGWGAVRVVGGLATNPVPLVVSHDGTNVTFSWPSSHTGWELQSQSNPLDIGLGTNWTVVSGSTATNEITLSDWISDELEVRAYRLAHPRFE
jgi:hypothetical protein